LGTLFLNFCLHELQKLNFNNHDFKNYLQVLALALKFVEIWKIKFKYLKVGEMFLQIFGFGWKPTKPPKIVIIGIIFLQLIFLVMYKHLGVLLFVLSLYD
jgi:hypothetical protein